VLDRVGADPQKVQRGSWHRGHWCERLCRSVGQHEDD
jgi:hypothetical protein